VLTYAKSKMGQQVGNGECWTLAFEALKAAGARLPGRNGVGVYDFGSKVSLKAIKPGDILQFENVTFRNASSFQNFPHHTAIVLSVSGSKITLLNQNADNVRKVVKTTINLADRKGGTIQAFRPIGA
jgi:hypothetical protein